MLSTYHLKKLAEVLTALGEDEVYDLTQPVTLEVNDKVVTITLVANTATAQGQDLNPVQDLTKGKRGA